MVARGDVIWADLGPPRGRRPLCVLTRDAAISVLTSVTCAPVTRTIRGIRSEVEIGTDEGLLSTSVIACDALVSVPLSLLDAQSVGHLDMAIRAKLDGALRYALDILY